MSAEGCVLRSVDGISTDKVKAGTCGHVYMYTGDGSSPSPPTRRSGGAWEGRTRTWNIGPWKLGRSAK